MDTIFAPTPTSTYAGVILPIAIKKVYTYLIPEALQGRLSIGMRVEVQFGKSKIYTGIVHSFYDAVEEGLKPKPILQVLDKKAVVTEQQLDLWKWISEYYACTLGEIMNAALPANLKLSSDTILSLSPTYDENDQTLSNKEFIIIESLRNNNELSLDQVRKILAQKTVNHIVQKLLQKRIIFLKESIKEKYKPKVVECVRLQFLYREEPDLLQEAFDLCAKSSRQMETLMAYIQIAKHKKNVSRSAIYQAAHVDLSVLKALVKKGIFEFYSYEGSRIKNDSEQIEKTSLSQQQKEAFEGIKKNNASNKVTLLHGVTGSGKTRVYIELMQEIIAKGGQVLYLIPEIALTAQIIERLKKVFDQDIAVYHSRLNNNERVEVWKAALAGKGILVGARSSLFLPFKNLKLIIVDEEHDASFKQTEPAPRYNARDVAVFMGHQHKIPVLLGTATPSIETYYNAQKNKYELVEMPERFGGIELPEMIMVDKRDEMKRKKMKSVFTSVLMEEISLAITEKKQVIIFQNRRGYSPTLNCQLCDWKMQCINCDVSLTYHKYANQYNCHYCGLKKHEPKECPQCGHHELELKGFGTEKIEDELKIFFPEARIARLDYDTAKSKNAYARIIGNFEEGDIDILVGTQMITKGLDFDNVKVVGVLSADQALAYPDFRSGERAYQLITQVAGRAGRKKEKGKVILQAFDVNHPVLKEVMDGNFIPFFERELKERKEFAYPPFSRMIKLTLKHKKLMNLQDGARILEAYLKNAMGARVQGPAIPYIGRIRNMYLMNFWIKLEKDPKIIEKAKKIIAIGSLSMQKNQGCASVRVIVDVDPN